MVPLEPPPLPAPSIGHLLRDRARRTPDRLFLAFEGKRLTFAEAEARSSQVANALAALGVAKGERVGIMLPNGLDYPLAWLGILQLGAVVVPINTGYRESDLSYILTDSGARMVITCGEHAPLLRQVRPRCPALEQILVWDQPCDAPDGTHALAFDVEHLRSSDLSVLQYTSGTTGFPKGCMLTHEYWLRLAGNAARVAALREDDVNLVMTAWYYMDATWNMLLCLLAGIPLVILPRFSASTFWQSVREHGATFFYCLGTIPVVLLKQPENPAEERRHRVRAVICSAIPPRLHAAIEARFGCPWREAYSTTEIGPVSLFVPLEDGSCVGSGAMGKPAPGCEARVADPASGRELGCGEIGELLVRGPGMMAGYWRNPEATADWLRGGWAHTGDLVHRDEKGYYHIVGRLKDMIRRGGENIAAAEVEAVLGEHPAVRMAACIPVADEVRGEEVKTFIQLQPGYSPEATPPETLLQFCRSKIAAFKVPRFVAYIDEFPLTPSQRIEKHRLSRERTGAYDAVTRTWT